MHTDPIEYCEFAGCRREASHDVVHSWQDADGPLVSEPRPYCPGHVGLAVYDSAVTTITPRPRTRREADEALARINEATR